MRRFLATVLCTLGAGLRKLLRRVVGDVVVRHNLQLSLGDPVGESALYSTRDNLLWCDWLTAANGLCDD